MRVFITDAGYKHTLAAVRSLGLKGVEVNVGSTSRYAVSFYSKYVRSRHLYPDPKQNPLGFVNFIKRLVEKGNYDVLLPIGYNTTVTTARFKDRLIRHLAVPVADYDTLCVAADKIKTLEFAEKIGIPVPKTIACKNINDVKKAVKELKFPMVIKGALETGRTTYASRVTELKSKCRFLSTLSSDGFLIQEYIPGDGYGFFGLLNKGAPRAIFMHKRVREYPIAGGPSTAAEGIYEPRLKELGLKMLRLLSWHGAAMVEFRKDFRDDEYKLMEINPKFWGSLDLAIVSGIDFPYLTCKMAVDGDVKPMFRYKVGVKFVWPFPDDFRRALADPLSIRDLIKDLIETRTRKNISLSDLNPNLIQILKSFVMIKRLATSKKQDILRTEFK